MDNGDIQRGVDYYLETHFPIEPVHTGALI